MAEKSGWRRTTKKAQGSQADAEWPAGRWMGCREGAECFGGSRVAWKTPSRKKVAKQLGGQQVTRGRRVPRRVPGVKKTPEGPEGRQSARRAQGDQKGAKLRVAKKAPSSLDCAGQSERELPSGQGAVQRVWSGAGYAWKEGDAGYFVCCSCYINLLFHL